MEQTKALNALEPFLALTKSATAPRAAADLVTQATSHPHTFVFAELLQAPQIQALSQSPEHAPYLALLEIFSFGTYTTYDRARADLPSLNDAQLLKLRQLSLLTLARDPGANLTYAALRESLGLPSGTDDGGRAVEDLVISAVYAGLLSAQLDPRRRTVYVPRVAPLRDLEPNSIPSMLTALRAWSGRCADTLSDLEAQIAAVRASARERHDEARARQETFTRLAEELKLGELSPSGDGLGISGPTRAGVVHSRHQARLLDRAVANLVGTQSRNGNKRGSGSLEPGNDECDDEAMDLDEEEPDDGSGEGGGGGGGFSSVAGAGFGGVAAGASAGKKRSSRRKI
ncbi:hypothetical protein GGS23DRAFT_357067 [Durotheca rogersii]|uniref:uncharacterized protein n=1 Tax=Durotheca rogersii TaxID=419775 RepID=UPI002220A4FF|nr:uncharacterized protein GGS23DRAFT_357067 [Durotheca rogersii]KAI5865845.1 hypothetical protein GGS23DRAFT_357067 [Durotheca rogersii]